MIITIPFSSPIRRAFHQVVQKAVWVEVKHQNPIPPRMKMRTQHLYSHRLKQRMCHQDQLLQTERVALYRRNSHSYDHQIKFEEVHFHDQPPRWPNDKHISKLQINDSISDHQYRLTTNTLYQWYPGCCKNLYHLWDSLSIFSEFIPFIIYLALFIINTERKRRGSAYSLVYLTELVELSNIDEI